MYIGGIFSEELFSVVQLREFFSKMAEPILKIPKILDSQWYEKIKVTKFEDERYKNQSHINQQ